MDFLLSTIISGLLYDAIKEGTKSLYMSLNLFFKYSNDKEILAISNELELMKLSQYQEILNYISTNSKILEYVKINDPYTTEFSKRLDYIFTLINLSYANRKEKYNSQKLAYDMKLKSYSEIKKYYIGNEEPEYSFIEKVSKFIGCNYKWLSAGEGEPFKSEIEYESNPYELLQYINSLNLQKLIVMISNEENPNISFVLKYNDLKFVSYSSYYPFSDDVGASGSRQIYNFYRLMKNLNRSMIIINTIKIEQDVMLDIIKGNKYPGIVENYNSKPYY